LVTQRGALRTKLSGRIRSRKRYDQSRSLSDDAASRSTANKGANQSAGDPRTLLTSMLSRKNPIDRRVWKRQAVKLREPSLIKCRRRLSLRVILAFDRSARLLTNITYRLEIAECHRAGLVPEQGLRARHRFFWRILLRRVFIEMSSGDFFERHRSLRRVAALLARDLARIRRWRRVMSDLNDQS
jgi:hypothetical protein